MSETTTEEKIQQAKEAEKKLEEKLKEHGVGGFWAKLLAAVIIAGVMVAAWMLQTSCSVTYTKLPDGTTQATGSVVLPQRVETVTTK